MREQSRLLPILLGTALLLVNCARSVPVAYYQLTSTPMAQKTAAPAQPVSELFGIGPITLPEYLDRPQIVSHRTSNQLQLAEFHRWAEPLGDNIARVLQDNLAHDLDSEQVVQYPWNPSLAVNKQITVEILHGETDAGGDMLFEARWTLQDKEGKILLPPQRSSHRIKVATPGNYGQQVAALSEALASFATEIAAGINHPDQGLR